MRTLGYILAGAAGGALVAFVLTLTVMYVALPLAGKSEPMVTGIAGALVLYLGGPLLAAVGAIVGFVRSRRKPA